MKEPPGQRGVDGASAPSVGTLLFFLSGEAGERAGSMICQTPTPGLLSLWGTCRFCPG